MGEGGGKGPESERGFPRNAEEEEKWRGGGALEQIEEMERRGKWPKGSYGHREADEDDDARRIRRIVYFARVCLEIKPSKLDLERQKKASSFIASLFQTRARNLHFLLFLLPFL